MILRARLITLKRNFVQPQGFDRLMRRGRGKFDRMFKACLLRPFPSPSLWWLWTTTFHSFGLLLWLGFFLHFLLALSVACFLFHSNTFNWCLSISSKVGVGIVTFEGILSTNKASKFVSSNPGIKRLGLKMLWRQHVITLTQVKFEGRGLRIPLSRW